MKTHSLCRVLQAGATAVGKTKSGFALLMLNGGSFTGIPSEVFSRLWQNACLRICADGGANLLHDFFTRTATSSNHYVPDVICGDLDSVRPDVIEYYSHKGTRVLQSGCQDTTDFQKSLALLRDNADTTCKMQKLSSQNSIKELDVVVLGATSGPMQQSGGYGASCLQLDGSKRIDHFFGNLHSTFAYVNEAKNPPSFLLLNPDNALFVLSEGAHELQIMRNDDCHSGLLIGRTKVTEENYCGLVPLFGEACVKTDGLQWNLDGSQNLVFGKFVSTSNRALGVSKAKDATAPITRGSNEPVIRVHVTSNNPVLWCHAISMTVCNPER